MAKNKLGFVLGILSLLTFWIPFLGTFIALCAIVISKSALGKKKEGGILAIIGLILGIIFLIVSLGCLGLVVFLFGSGYLVGKIF